jgi:hypothetical protein
MPVAGLALVIGVPVWHLNNDGSVVSLTLQTRRLAWRDGQSQGHKEDSDACQHSLNQDVDAACHCGPL